MNYELITKEQFDAACAKFPASSWIKFAFKYFSSSTEKKDLKLSKTIVNILVVTFIVLFVGVIFEVRVKFLIPFILVYCGLLIPMIALMFFAVNKNNLRHDKIRKELGGITINEYMILVNKYNP